LSFGPTPSQTVGPYFAICLPFDGQEFVVPEGTPGSFRIFGTVYDGASEPIPDHVIETWQPDLEGRFADLHCSGGASQMAGFRGFARHAEEDGEGNWEIVTVKPGRVPDAGGELQAPHIDVTVMARGMLHRVVTRIYFADESDANATDPVLASVPSDRRHTLLAQPTDGGYQFDIRIQGDDETVFFHV
jgi:protocatechuate 3,4-dioxygenase alpha subunit